MVTTEAGNLRIFFSIDVSFGGCMLLDGHQVSLSSSNWFFNKFDSMFDSLTELFRWLYVNIRRKPSRTTHHDESKTFVY